MNRWTLAVAVLLSASLVDGSSEPLEAEDAATLLKEAQSLFKPLASARPESPELPARVALGRMLFFDPR